MNSRNEEGREIKKSENIKKEEYSQSINLSGRSKATSCEVVDFGVFVSIWNVYQGYTTPSIHFRMAKWLETCWVRGEQQLLLMAFRASGKSTLVALFSAWLLCKDQDLRILVLAAESALALKMARMIRKIVENHPLAIHLKPKNPEMWSADSFTVNRERASRDPSVLARGLYSNTTGTRADIIICDDVEVPNTCDTADKREKLRERLAENDFILTPDGVQIYVGTPHSYYTIYARQARKEIGETTPFLKGFRRLSIPLLRPNGRCVWPERYLPDDIDRIRRMSGPAKFSSQMMLDPVNILEGRLDPSLLHHYAEDLDYQEIQKKAVLRICGRRLVSASAWWDPAFGGSEKRDNSVLAVVYTDEEGEYWLHRMAYIQTASVHDNENDDEASRQCRAVAEILDELYLPSVCVETNGIGKFLPAILRRTLGEGGIGCSVVEKVSTRPKDIRILEAFDAVMAARALHVHESVFQTPFVREMQEWRPGVSSTSHDDGLDAAAGALSLEPVRLRHSVAGKRKIWKDSGRAHIAKNDFEF